MATPNIVPRADSEGGLGIASKYWGSAYIDTIYVGAGKMGRDADNFFDFSTDNTVVLRLNGGNELVFNTAQIHPSVHDGLGLGYAGRGFSDLFLASGAVINFDSGNVLLTHSSGALTLADNQKFNFGDDNDLDIHHGGTNSFIQNQTGDLYIVNRADGENIIFQSDDGSGGVETYLLLDGNANNIKAYKDIRFQDNEKAQFGQSGDLNIYHNATNLVISNLTGHLYIQNTADDSDIVFQCDDGSGGVTSYFTLDGGVSTTIFSKDALFSDNINLAIGDSLDLFFVHNGTSSFITQQGAGDLYIRNITNDKDVILQSDDGAGGSTTYFYLDGSSAAHDGSATTALYTNWPDKSRITFGTSHDFQVYHAGDHSHLYSLTGNLYITNSADDADIIFACDNGSGGTTEYFRLDGGNVRTIASQHIQMADGKALYVGEGLDAGFYHSSGHNYIESNTGDLTFVQNTDDGDIKFYSDDGSGGTAQYFRLDGGEVETRFLKATLHYDNVWAKFGDSGDLRIYHDGSNSYIDESGTGILKIRGDNQIQLTAPTGGEVYAIFNKDGACEFRHNDVTKLATSSDGVSVTGNVSATSYKTGSTTVLQGDADVIVGSSGGTGTISLTTHTSTPFKIENDDSITMSPTKIVMSNLPTSDPGTTGQLWNDNGTLKISAGG